MLNIIVSSSKVALVSARTISSNTKRRLPREPSQRKQLNSLWQAIGSFRFCIFVTAPAKGTNHPQDFFLCKGTLSPDSRRKRQMVYVATSPNKANMVNSRYKQGLFQLGQLFLCDRSFFLPQVVIDVFQIVCETSPFVPCFLVSLFIQCYNIYLRYRLGIRLELLTLCLAIFHSLLYYDEQALSLLTQTFLLFEELYYTLTHMAILTRLKCLDTSFNSITVKRLSVAVESVKQFWYVFIFLMVNYRILVTLNCCFKRLAFTIDRHLYVQE